MSCAWVWARVSTPATSNSRGDRCGRLPGGRITNTVRPSTVGTCDECGVTDPPGRFGERSHDADGRPLGVGGSGKRIPRTILTGPPSNDRTVRCLRSSPTWPDAARPSTARRTLGSTSRQRANRTTRAISLGQSELLSERFRNIARTAATLRACSVSSVGSSHHGDPRSPSATLASSTRRRALATASSEPTRCAAPTARRAADSSFTSSERNRSGMFGSVARHRRPSTTMYRPSGVRSGGSTIASHRFTNRSEQSPPTVNRPRNRSSCPLDTATLMRIVGGSTERASVGHDCAAR